MRLKRSTGNAAHGVRVDSKLAVEGAKVCPGRGVEMMQGPLGTCRHRSDCDGYEIMNLDFEKCKPKLHDSGRLWP